jgi:outer membrane autotransporter protein
MEAIDNCAWAQLEGAAFDQDDGFDRLATNESAVSVSAGFERRLSPTWTIGGGIAYEHAWTDVGDRAEIDTDRFKAGLAVKRQDGPLLLGFSLVAGYGWSDGSRSIALPGPVTAQADFDSSFIGGTVRAGYQFRVERWLITPRVDVDVTHVHLDGISEQGAGPLNLITGSVSDTLVTIRPGIEFDAEMTMASGAMFRPHLYAGLVYAPDASLAMSAIFEGTPAGIAPFTIVTETDELMGEFGFGADFFGTNGARVSAHYGLTVGSETIAHNGSIKLRIGF